MIACNIATCFSELDNTKVLLIDCDFAKRGVSIYFSSILLNSQSMKDIVSKFREEYDYVFIDSPPISRMNDACIITQYLNVNNTAEFHYINIRIKEF